MKTSTIAGRRRPPLPPIHLGRSDRDQDEARSALWLVRYLRLLALLWRAQGFATWASLVVGDPNGLGVLSRMTDVGAAAVMFFAVLDLIAAVGLWLAAAWGGVVWLVAVAAQWLCLVLLPGFFPFDVAVGVADLALVAGYFVLTYRAARDIDQ